MTAKPLVRNACYPGNAEDIVGEEFYAPYLYKNGRSEVYRWVATSTIYVEHQDYTEVEFEGGPVL